MAVCFHSSILRSMAFVSVVYDLWCWFCGMDHLALEHTTEPTGEQNIRLSAI